MLRFYFLVVFTIFQITCLNAEPLLGFYGSPMISSEKTREAWLGKPIMLTWNGGPATYFLSNSASWHLSPISKLLKERPGRQLVYTYMPFRETRNGHSDQTLTACAAGAYDSDYIKFANALRIHGLTNIILRIGHEFTGEWYSWSSRGKEGSFANCYRRIVDVIRKTVPTNTWKFDWNPVGRVPASILNATYPGDKYVDYITTDIYDSAKYSGTYPYPVPCDGSCRYARQYKNWYYTKLQLDSIKSFAVVKKKPFAITEWGVWSEKRVHGNHEGGGDNPYFIAQMHKYINDPANNIAYSVYFDVNTSEGNHKLCCGTSTEFPNSAKKFVELFGKSMRLTLIDPIPAEVLRGDYVDVSVNLSSNTEHLDSKVSIVVHDAQYNREVYVVTTQDIKPSLENNLHVRFQIPKDMESGTYTIGFSIYDTAFKNKIFYVSKLGTFKVQPVRAIASYQAEIVSQSATTIKPGGMVNLTANLVIPKAEKLLVVFVLVGPSGKVMSKTISIETKSDNSTVPVSATLAIPSNALTGEHRVSLYVYRASDYQTRLFIDRLAKFNVAP